MFSLLQSLSTGDFLTLDVATAALKDRWGFDGDTIVQIGTVGYALGFLGVGLFNVFIGDSIALRYTALIGGGLTCLSWFLLWISLCPHCLPWWVASLLEAGVCMGTALGYTCAVKLVTQYTASLEVRKWKILALSLSVSVGSVAAFILFVFLPDLNHVFLGVAIFSVVIGISIFMMTLLNPPTEEQIPLIGSTFSVPTPISSKPSAPFYIYLFALNLSFGTIVTLINSASNMILSTDTPWHPQVPLICLVMGNLIGRISGFFVKPYIKYCLLLFAFFSVLSSIGQFVLLLYWDLWVLLVTLLLNGVFFGLIWSLTMILAKDFFGLGEARSLGFVFFGMVGGPLVFGPFAAFIYHRHLHHNDCDAICYRAYLILSCFANLLNCFAYIAAWQTQKWRQNIAPPIRVTIVEPNEPIRLGGSVI